jgi:DnaJ-class molecular chaperone
MKCFRCNGKGEIKQITSYFPDEEPDTNWDICPNCEGTGKELDSTVEI